MSEQRCTKRGSGLVHWQHRPDHRAEPTDFPLGTRQRKTVGTGEYETILAETPHMPERRTAPIVAEEDLVPALGQQAIERSSSCPEPFSGAPRQHNESLSCSEPIEYPVGRQSIVEMERRRERQDLQPFGGNDLAAGEHQKSALSIKPERPGFSGGMKLGANAFEDVETRPLGEHDGGGSASRCRRGEIRLRLLQRPDRALPIVEVDMSVDRDEIWCRPAHPRAFTGQIRSATSKLNSGAVVSLAPRTPW